MSDLVHHYHDIHQRLINGYGNGVPDTPINLKDRQAKDRVGALERQIEALSKRLLACEAKLAPPAPSQLSACETIIRFIVKTEGITKIELMSRQRGAVIVRMRHIGFYLCCHLTGKTTSQIAAAWQRDHTSIMHGRDKVKRLRSRHKDVDKLVSWYEVNVERELVNNGHICRDGDTVLQTML